MNITKEIDRKNKMDSELKAIEETARIAKESVEREYNKKECNHDILIKMYGSVWSRDFKAPVYMCLGCKKRNVDIENYDDAQEFINPKNRFIIDFTASFKSHEYINGDNLLILYLQTLAKEVEERMPDFKDSDFVEMISCNTEYIKTPKDFNPKKS